RIVDVDMEYSLKSGNGLLVRQSVGYGVYFYNDTAYSVRGILMPSPRAVNHSLIKILYSCVLVSFLPKLSPGHDGRMNVQSKNVGNVGRNTGSVVGNFGNVVFGQSANGSNAILRVRDSNYFKEKMMIAKKDEAGTDFNTKENDFLLVEDLLMIQTLQMRQICNGDLEAAFYSNTSYIQSLEADDILTGSHESNFYTISIS
nr:hypothetical protein [Tanacetum cinerariifolium]